MKDYKPSLLQLLNECILVHLEMVLLTLIDFRELEIVLLFGVGRKSIFSCQIYCMLGFPCEKRAEVFVSLQLLTHYKASS